MAERRKEKTIVADLNHQKLYRDKIAGCGYIIFPADVSRGHPPGFARPVRPTHTRQIIGSIDNTRAGGPGSTG
jgi:hypothetical protein